MGSCMSVGLAKLPSVCRSVLVPSQLSPTRSELIRNSNNSPGRSEAMLFAIELSDLHVAKEHSV